MIRLTEVSSWSGITVLLLAVAVSGCAAGNYAYRGYGDGGYDVVSSQTRYAGVNSSVSNSAEYGGNDIVKKVAAMRADVEHLKEVMNELRLRLNENEQAIGRIKSRLGDIHNQGSMRQQSERGRISELRNKISELETALANERQARRKADKELVNTVSSEVSAALSTLGENSQRAGGLEARGTYTVQQGDTLSAISDAFNVTVDDLKQINNLKNNLIRVGQKLLIPEK